jgi:hypothetical protein
VRLLVRFWADVTVGGVKKGRGTYGSTSWRRRFSSASRPAAKLPVPPRPVVTIEVFRVGVCRSSGWSCGALELSTMLPAPPRPEDWRWDMMICSDGGVLLGG